MVKVTFLTLIRLHVPGSIPDEKKKNKKKKKRGMMKSNYSIHLKLLHLRGNPPHVISTFSLKMKQKKLIKQHDDISGMCAITSLLFSKA